MSSNKRTSMAITAERRNKIEAIARIKSLRGDKIYLWTDIVNEIIDDYIAKNEGEMDKIMNLINDLDFDK
ncbi:hypothetical protein [Providencia huaxiensis]|uniref:hypothetical protein n=1 Tax=Providencia huaxiensis TaxID=2027290 RepID=UPI000C7F4521|nr:hypothetical protein [Providencia huaxiensis]AXH60531.2 hypothetical protein CYG50_00070 [Providencia huaxiensis]